jgi:hypothetical protein
MILAMCVALGLAAQTDSQAAHHARVVQRGESHAGMDFSQTTSTHHFILTPDGGIVQVTANDSANTEQIEAIQMHMKHIARCSRKETSQSLTSLTVAALRSKPAHPRV